MTARLTDDIDSARAIWISRDDISLRIEALDGQDPWIEAFRAQRLVGFAHGKNRSDPPGPDRSGLNFQDLAAAFPEHADLLRSALGAAFARIGMSGHETMHATIELDRAMDAAQRTSGPTS